MGWSFECADRGRKSFIESLTGAGHFSQDYEPLEHRVVGNHVWQLVRHTPTDRKFICLDLIAKERGAGWGYKGLNEDMGPYHYDCPLALLDKASPPANEHAKAWREKVRAHHAARKAAPKPAAGMVVSVGGQEYMLLESLGPRRGWIVVMVGGSGMRYRLGAGALARALQAGVQAGVPA